MSMWKKNEGSDVSIESNPREQTGQPRSTPAPSPGPSTSATSAIGPSLSVKGDISGYEDLVIHGQLEGEVNLQKNTITVGQDGKVKATLDAVKITVEGQVTGDLSGSERVVIRTSGKVEGNITAPRVVLEDGCRFKGSVEMNFDEKNKATTSKPSVPAREEGRVSGVTSSGSSQVVSQAK
ncbi:MAG: polymer-forming cytoskeletal protein [Gammaproteobacteria bacterium]|nr:polymer-forming cytoskeletal protein [Gammaproteobacteria bacterium]